MVFELAVAADCRYIVTHNLRDFAGVEAFGVEASQSGEFPAPRILRFYVCSSFQFSGCFPFPESLRRSVEELVRDKGISLDQFVASATAEKLAAWQGLDFLRQEAAQGRLEDLKSFLAQVPDGEPLPTDRLLESESPA